MTGRASVCGESDASRAGEGLDAESKAIAIVGLAFRFPGDLADEQTLWTALMEGQDLVTHIQSDRWAVDELRHPTRAEPGRGITFSAGVLSRIDEFDAGFFGISPREAAWLDPQQRLLLELAWEAMENGGRRPSSLAGSNCGVYVGISSLDYGTRGLDDLASLSSHFMTGNTLSIAANRLSYVYDLHGPSLAIDTACSSSLVALHHACNALRAGEVSEALVGGVNLLLHPYPFVGFTKASMLSADGHCRAFDASGNGYVRSEGAAVLLLKPFAKAVSDGDDIQAVIRASGANSDGARKTGITIPSSDGQAELMRAVLARSGLAARDIDFVEAHGTGTAVGDPVESAAIGSVYGRGRAPNSPLPIGSVKANLGHLEPASGMAGLVKAVLVLKNRALPPAVNLANPNRKIDFAALNLELVREARVFREDDKALVGVVNSFGFGGANAHVVVQEHRPPQGRARLAAVDPLPSLVLSARSEAALAALAGRYAELLRDKSSRDYYDIAYAAAHARDPLEIRLALKPETPEQASEQLVRFANGEQVEGIVVEEALPEAGSVAFVYSGNGAQWAGMGRRLLAESPRFAALMAELDAGIRPLTEFSIIEELNAEGLASSLDDTMIAQPLLFAIQVAVTTLLREQGVRPTAVVGHSVGEVAAAWAAGALDIDQAIRVICTRSQTQGKTRGAGRMAAVALSVEAMTRLLIELGAPDVEIAGINSPGNITISGNEIDLACIHAHLQPKGVFFRLLDLDYAFHSRHMDVIEGAIAAGLADISPKAADRATFVSTVTGCSLDGAKLDASYWWHNVRDPVRFADAISTLIGNGCRVFVEIAPHAILQRYIGECLAHADVRGRAIPTLRRNDDGVVRINEAALRCQLLSEADLDCRFPRSGRRVRLPNYPWQRERHWHPTTTESLASISRRRVHPLLGWRLHAAIMAWENTVDTEILPWLSDHRVGGAVVFPGSAYVEIALAAAREWRNGARSTIEELDILAPMVVEENRARTLRITLNPRDGGFRIKSRRRLSEDEWTLHAVGRVLEAAPSMRWQAVPRIELADESAETIGGEHHYRLARMIGLDYGPAFQGLSRSHVCDERLSATLDVPQDILADSTYLLHPAVLDVSYQVLVDFFRADIESGGGVALLPVKVGRVDLYSTAAPVAIRALLRRRGARSVMADFELLDEAGKLVASVSACRFRAAPLVSRDNLQVAGWALEPWLRPHPVDGAATRLPAVAELLQSMGKVFGGQEMQRRAWYKEALPLFEAVTLSFAHEAFQRIAMQGGDALRQLIEMQPASPYVRWLAGLLKQENLLVEHDGKWRLEDNGALPPACEIWQALLRDTPSCLPQLMMLGRVCNSLPDLLTGKQDGFELLAALRQSPVAESLYDDDPAYAGSSFAIESVLRDLAGALPPNRRLRILEICAGASRLPRAVADLLPEDRLDYVLALPNEVQRERQHSEYQDHANVVVAAMNVAEWKLESELPLPEVFDVVVLRHVVHQAANPHAALVRAKRWLAAGGLLLLGERYPDWSVDVVDGLDPAWWREEAAPEPGQSTRLRSSLLAPEAWLQALAAEGLADVSVFHEPAAEELAEGAYLVVAKRAADDIVQPVVPAASTWLMIADTAGSSMAAHLCSSLESLAQDVVVAAPGEAHTFDAANLVLLVGWGGTAVEAPAAAALLQREVRSLAEKRDQSTHLWIVTCGGALVSGLTDDCAPNPAQSVLWGFGRVVMNEYPGLSCTLIDIACDPAAPGMRARVENELLRPDGAEEIILTVDARHAPTLRADTAKESAFGVQDRFRLDFEVPGQLRNLVWLAAEERPLGDDEIEVRTCATGLNFRDVMYLMGLLPDEAVENGFAGASLGLEFSGVVTRAGARVRGLLPGDSVMGFGSSCFASHIVTRADAVARMPEGWSFEAAATVPTVFFTVYYAFKHLADLQPGERVLIHGGAGGVGIAAIQLARHLGAEVFATAGSEEKRDFVRLLGADHVFDSRSLEFADDIRRVTGGEGVDVVLNSLAGEAIRRSLGVLRPFGRFLELGKRDFFENTPVGLRPFKDNISYFGIDADQLLTARPALAARLFRDVMVLFHEGVLSPLPYRSFAVARIVDAFRVMQQARHIGKLVVAMADDRPKIDRRPVAQEPIRIDKDDTWLVTGGLAGLGLETARWLVSRGARNLVLLGRRGKETPGATEALAEFAARGVHVLALACDVADRQSLAAVLERTAKTLPPLRGIVHAAMVIDDKLIANLDAVSLETVLRPKLLGAWNLHELTLDIPLNHFVLFSSITTSIGNPGQAAYVAANAGLEGLVRLRRHLGLPAASIGWGPIGDVGYLTRNEAVRDSLALRLGRDPLKAGEALDQLDRVLAENTSQSILANFDWSVLSPLLPSSRGVRFALLNRSLADSGPSEVAADIRTLIVGKSADEVAAMVRDLVIQEVALILSIGVNRIAPDRSLHDLGMDSLMAVELALGLERRFGIQLPVMMLNDAPTADRVTARIIEKLLEHDGQVQDADAATGAMVENLVRQHGEDMSGAEIERLAQDAQSLARTGTRRTA